MTEQDRTQELCSTCGFTQSQHEQQVPDDWTTDPAAYPCSEFTPAPLIRVTHNERRTDPLRPQVFDPADVEVVGFADLKPPMFAADPLLVNMGFAAEALELARQHRAEWEAYMTSLFGTPFPGRQCAHCGHPGIRWAFAVKYLPTGQVFPFGEICGDERAELTNRDAFDRRALRMAAERQAERERLLAEMSRFAQENPEIIEFLGAIHRDHGGSPTDQLPFVNDMVRAFERYGYLTERQLAAVVKIRAKREEWAARRAEERADRGPAPEGRVTVEGAITKVVWKDDPVYGGGWKMTVELDNGAKVWGTLPRALDNTIPGQDIPEDGTRIRFTAAFTPKQDDPTFAWFKRPTKAEVIS